MELFSASKSVFMHRSVCDYRGETATYTLPATTQILRCNIVHTHHLGLPLCVLQTLTYQHIPPAHPVVSLCVTSNYSARSRCWRGQPRPLPHDHRGPAASRGLWLRLHPSVGRHESMSVSVCVCGLQQHHRSCFWMCVCVAVCGGGASDWRPKAGLCGFDLSQASYGFNWLGNNYIVGRKWWRAKWKNAGMEGELRRK